MEGFIRSNHINTNINTHNELFNNQTQNNNMLYSNNIKMDLNEIINILSNKMNNVYTIDDELIKSICDKIISHCKNHNMMINEWFDNDYQDNLFLLKKNNEDYTKLSNKYETKSFIVVKTK